MAEGHREAARSVLDRSDGGWNNPGRGAKPAHVLMVATSPDRTKRGAEKRSTFRHFAVVNHGDIDFGGTPCRNIVLQPRPANPACQPLRVSKSAHAPVANTRSARRMPSRSVVRPAAPPRRRRAACLPPPARGPPGIAIANLADGSSSISRRGRRTRPCATASTRPLPTGQRNGHHLPAWCADPLGRTPAPSATRSVGRRAAGRSRPAVGSL